MAEPEKKHHLRSSMKVAGEPKGEPSQPYEAKPGLGEPGYALGDLKGLDDADLEDLEDLDDLDDLDEIDLSRMYKQNQTGARLGCSIYSDSDDEEEEEDDNDEEFLGFECEASPKVEDLAGLKQPMVVVYNLSPAEVVRLCSEWRDAPPGGHGAVKDEAVGDGVDTSRPPTLTTTPSTSTPTTTPSSGSSVSQQRSSDQELVSVKAEPVLPPPKVEKQKIKRPRGRPRVHPIGGPKPKRIRKRVPLDRYRKKRFMCGLCPKAYHHKYHVKRHILAKHSSGGDPFSCEHCSYTCGQIEQLKTHLISKHDIGKRLPCPYCKFTASHIGILNRHKQAKHETTHPHKCNLCDYTCPRRADLKYHFVFAHKKKAPPKTKDSSIRHLNLDKPYKCQFCDASFFIKGGFKRHLTAMHKLGEPFKCELCTYTCAQKFNLKRHKFNKHGVGKAFWCNMCLKCYGSMADLRTHLINKHNVLKKFKCGFCQYSTEYKHCMKKHELTVHSM